MNIPNVLTLFRLFLVPVFVLVFFSPVNHYLIFSISIFLLAGITDVLDGFIARKYNLITKWGMVLDPLADKLMLLTVLTCLTINRIIPIWIVGLIAAKEIFMIISGMFLYRKDTVIPSNKFGKASTLLFYLSVFILSLNEHIGDSLLVIAVISAFIALINYSLIYFRGKDTEK
ncbi:MAG: CDP-diacylglycerol--glycerol-3-phosphate 3-phosphatidyltransferase [Bacillota bacterium]|nr:CDP-diacylglycerol--glycerol-3-phosphate 3-phosphatidyltransferase [Bacillota bacterium]